MLLATRGLQRFTPWCDISAAMRMVCSVSLCEYVLSTSLASDYQIQEAALLSEPTSWCSCDNFFAPAGLYHGCVQDSELRDVELYRCGLLREDL